MGMVVIQPYILVSKLKKIKTKFLSCTGYLNSIKKPYKARFIANSSSCTTKELILDKLKARDFNATSLSTYDFSTLYTTLPHNLIKVKPRLWCLTVSLSLSHWYPGSGVVLDCIDS